ncbi:hypothetical protein MTQ01_19345 [Streptomyces sp. XM4193]|uniref:hypothetical protein n=1 Tax=Streptomyces sp. XM4193 TaxID=2929782 RepID=UPI001FF924C6|nr:hypothetical protein [Streptomyces sp. XM4193]MCK1798145.1 hypothetical protein [Streptomyces sp. XM4193]
MIDTYDHLGADALHASVRRALPGIVELLEQARRANVSFVHVNDEFGRRRSHHGELIECAQGGPEEPGGTRAPVRAAASRRAPWMVAHTPACDFRGAGACARSLCGVTGLSRVGLSGQRSRGNGPLRGGGRGALPFDFMDAGDPGQMSLLRPPGGCARQTASDLLADVPEAAEAAAGAMTLGRAENGW